MGGAAEVEGVTGEQLEQEQRPDDALEGHVPAPAPALVAALANVQDVVAPVDPGGGEIEQGEGQDDGGGGGVRHGDHVDQQDGPDLAAVADAVGGERVRLLQVRFRDCGVAEFWSSGVCEIGDNLEWKTLQP